MRLYDVLYINQMFDHLTFSQRHAVLVSIEAAQCTTVSNVGTAAYQTATVPIAVSKYL